MTDALERTLRRDAISRHNATVTIVRPTGTTFGSGTYTDTTTPVYTGAALVMPVNAEEKTPEYGGEDVNTRRYKIQLAADTDVQPDDKVTVTAGGLDDDLNDAEMVVVDVEWSSRQVARNIVCLHNRGA